MVKLCIIGDRLTVTGLELAGLKNMYIADKENITDVIRNLNDKFDVILITQSLAKNVSKEIDSLRRKDKIVVEIPDREGGGEETIRKMVRDFIGFELVK